MSNEGPHGGPTAGGGTVVEVSREVWELAPDYVLGLIALPSVQVRSDDPGVEARLSAAEARVAAAGLNRAAVGALPGIAAWRAAYAAFGANGNQTPCAAESLLRRVVRAGRLPRINALVDLCNAVSLTAAAPVAACELSGIPGRLSVRQATGLETFHPLGDPDRPEHPAAGEVVYADSAGRAHSRRWNWRQSEQLKTEPGLRQVLITVETAHPDGGETVERAMGELTAALDELSLGDVAAAAVLRPGRSSVALPCFGRAVVPDRG